MGADPLLSGSLGHTDEDPSYMFGFHIEIVLNLILPFILSTISFELNLQGFSLRKLSLNDEIY